jgi:hypothetical protein
VALRGRPNRTSNRQPFRCGFASVDGCCRGHALRRYCRASGTARSVAVCVFINCRREPWTIRGSTTISNPRL